MQDLFSIGQMSQLFDIKISTLRYYDEIGLLKPAYIDPNSGYRYYSSPQFERLNTIKYLRTLNMPLDKIIDFFENKSISHLLQLLGNHQSAIQDQIQQLQRINRKLEHRLTQINDAANSILAKVKLIDIPARDIVFLKKDLDIHTDLEYPIRELEQLNELEPVMFLGKVGLLVSAKKINLNQFGQFSGIFVLLEPEDNYCGTVHTLPAGLYLTIRFSGTHSEAAPYYYELLTYADTHDLMINGDAIEITLVDSGFTNFKEHYVTEIQIPVSNL